MQSIEIQQHPRSFSHDIGSFVWLPGSLFALKIYPCKIGIYSLWNLFEEEGALHLALEGPCSHFVIEQDWIRGTIFVKYVMKHGCVRYVIQADTHNDDHSILFVLKSHDEIDVHLQFPSKTHPDVWHSCQPLYYGAHQETSLETLKTLTKERFFCGVHKQPDIRFITTRCDPREFIPLWFHAALSLPSNLISLSLPLYPENKTPPSLEEHFKLMFRRFFTGGMVPSLEDHLYQGLHFDISWEHPFAILLEGKKMIENCFLKVEDSSIHLLPSLLPSVYCGKWLNKSLGDGNFIDIEWSKKTMRRAIIKATQSQSYHFVFSQKTKKCRVRTSLSQKGRWIQQGESFDVVPNTTYLFDSFED